MVLKRPNLLLKFFGKYKKSNLFTFSNDNKTVDQSEIKNFSNISDWWESNGSMQALKAYNITRIDYIKKILSIKRQIDPKIRYPFKNIEFLDVGCGGGLLSESLARLGGIVTGIDPTENSVKVAQNHAKKDSDALKTLKYINISSDEFSKQNIQFDVITSMEVIEHVKNKMDFIKNLSILLKPDGCLIMSTFNKTAKSYIFGIVMAEYLSRIVPIGTHDWNKFISPDDLIKICNDNNLINMNIQGVEYSPLDNSMNYCSNVQSNYMIAFEKKKTHQKMTQN